MQLVSNLKYLFHKVFQYGMMEYVNRRKISEAACRLIKTQESVCQVAFYYGFSSQEVFTRAFYKIWQETPGVYRKKRHFFGLYPRQEFICDECGVFRRRYDLTGLAEELNARDCSAVVCFDIVGIRFIKTCYGKEAGEAAALHALQRLEDFLGGDCSIYRLAGDKFAVNLGGAGYYSARNETLKVLEANGTSFTFKGNEISLSMFAGVCQITAGAITSKQLFDSLNFTVLMDFKPSSSAAMMLPGFTKVRSVMFTGNPIWVSMDLPVASPVKKRIISFLLMMKQNRFAGKHLKMNTNCFFLMMRTGIGKQFLTAARRWCGIIIISSGTYTVIRINALHLPCCI
nr:helix-turn-helix domain-containing protein [uncultured Clostridium sp.]